MHKIKCFINTIIRRNLKLKPIRSSHDFHSFIQQPVKVLCWCKPSLPQICCSISSSDLLFYLFPRSATLSLFQICFISALSLSQMSIISFPKSTLFLLQMCIIPYALFLSYMYYLFSRYVLSLFQMCLLLLQISVCFHIASPGILYFFPRSILSLPQISFISFPDSFYLFSRCVLCFFHMCIITFPYLLSLLQIGFISSPDLLLDPLYLFSRSILSFYDMHFVSSQICFIFFLQMWYISSPDWLHLSSRSALSLP